MNTLLWIDVETTGLNPYEDTLLEIGMLHTDTNLNPIGQPLDLILHWDGQPSPFIQTMHKPNGLLDACKTGLDPEEAYRQAREYAHQYDNTLIAGNTIRFDRLMLDTHDPHILKNLNHRSLDISSLNEAARLWNPQQYANRPEKTTNHRSLNCLKDSLTLARHYQQLIKGTACA